MSKTLDLNQERARRLNDKDLYHVCLSKMHDINGKDELTKDECRRILAYLQEAMTRPSFLDYKEVMERATALLVVYIDIGVDG